MERIHNQNGGQKQQHQQHQQQQQQHQQHQQHHQQQQQLLLLPQRQHLGSTSSNCSSGCPPKSPLISSHPAFQYFKDKDQPARRDQRIDGRKVEENEGNSNTTVTLVATMPKKKSPVVGEQTTKPSNKIHIITNSSTTRSSHNDLNNNSNSKSSSCSSEPVTESAELSNKTKYSVSKLIRQHHDEIQSNSQFKRFSGNERCKWFFRSLRGERAPKSSDEASGSESGSVIRDFECSRCRLASLTTSQLEESVDTLQSSLAEKSSKLERLSAELVERDSKLQQMETNVKRLASENNELKASINHLISEQHFGRRVLMTFDTEYKSSSGGQDQFNSAPQYASTLGAKGRSACLSQPSLTLTTDLYNGARRESESETRNGISTSVRNINGLVKNHLASIRSVGYDDDDDNADDEAAVFSAAERNRRHYPVIKPKPLHVGHDTTPMNRRIRELSLTDREWHSSEGFSSRVATAATARTTASGTADDYTKERRSAKSSLELDDSLCVEYPNRTFRQQMECLKGVAKSVESLKSESAGRRFKPRRRRGTVAAPGEDMAYPMPDHYRLGGYNFPISSTRKLSNYSLQQQQQQQQQHYQQQQQLQQHCKIDDFQSEIGPTTHVGVNRLIRANSTDYIDHSADFQLHGRQQPERHRLPEFDPRHYYLRGQHSNNNTSSSSGSNGKNLSKEGELIIQLKRSMERMEKERTKEQRIWLDEKMRVIEYQKKLQDAYLGLSSQCRKLELELRQLRGTT